MKYNYEQTLVSLLAKETKDAKDARGKFLEDPSQKNTLWYYEQEGRAHGVQMALDLWRHCQ